MTDLKAAVFTVLEGWALPLDARKILETAYYAQPEQEPVCDKDPHLCGFVQCQLGKVCKNTPINTMPKKIVGPNLEQILNAAGFYRREWVGLTNDEINDFSAGCHLGKSVQTAIYQAAAKLKEKNT